MFVEIRTAKPRARQRRSGAQDAVCIWCRPGPADRFLAALIASFYLSVVSGFRACELIRGSADHADSDRLETSGAGREAAGPSQEDSVRHEPQAIGLVFTRSFSLGRAAPRRRTAVRSGGGRSPSRSVSCAGTLSHRNPCNPRTSANKDAGWVADISSPPVPRFLQRLFSRTVMAHEGGHYVRHSVSRRSSTW